MQTLRWAPFLGAVVLAHLPQQAMAANDVNLTFTGVASPGFRDGLFDPSMSSPTVSFAGQPVTIHVGVAYPGGVASVTAFSVSWSNQTFSLPVLTNFSGVGGSTAFLSLVSLTNTGGTIDISPSDSYIGANDGWFDLDLSYTLPAPHSPSAPFTDTVTGGGSLDGFVMVESDPTFGYYDNTVSGDFTLTSLTSAPAPEPAAWATMLIGLFGLGVALRARRQATAAG